MQSYKPSMQGTISEISFPVRRIYDTGHRTPVPSPAVISDPAVVDVKQPVRGATAQPQWGVGRMFLIYDSFRSKVNSDPQTIRVKAYPAACFTEDILF